MITALHTRLTRALDEQYQATITPRHPVNYAFSSLGTEKCVH
jgi:hypothetical protein